MHHYCTHYSVFITIMCNKHNMFILLFCLLLGSFSDYHCLSLPIAFSWFSWLSVLNCHCLSLLMAFSLCFLNCPCFSLRRVLSLLSFPICHSLSLLIAFSWLFFLNCHFLSLLLAFSLLFFSDCHYLSLLVAFYLFSWLCFLKPRSFDWLLMDVVVFMYTCVHVCVTESVCVICKGGLVRGFFGGQGWPGAHLFKILHTLVHECMLLQSNTIKCYYYYYYGILLALVKV